MVDVGEQGVGQPAALDVEVGQPVELEPLRLRRQDVPEELVLLEVALGVEVEARDVVHVVALGRVQQVHRDALHAVGAERRLLLREHAAARTCPPSALVQDGVAERLAHDRLDRAVPREAHRPADLAGVIALAEHEDVEDDVALLPLELGERVRARRRARALHRRRLWLCGDASSGVRRGLLGLRGQGERAEVVEVALEVLEGGEDEEEALLGRAALVGVRPRDDRLLLALAQVGAHREAAHPAARVPEQHRRLGDRLAQQLLRVAEHGEHLGLREGELGDLLLDEGDLLLLAIDAVDSMRRLGSTRSLFCSTMLFWQFCAICFALRWTRRCFVDMRCESSLRTLRMDASMCV